MIVMLMALFASVAFGLFAKAFGRRETLICAAIAAMMTLVYFVRPMLMT